MTTGLGTRRWGAATLWHLAWLATMLYQPLLDPHGPEQWLVLAAIVVVFVPFYLRIYGWEGRIRRWAPALTLALALLAVPLNSGASILLVYAAGFAGSFRPQRESTAWFVALTVVLVGLGLLSPVPLPWRLWAFLPSLVLIWVVGMMTATAREGERADRIRNAQVEHLATLSERERIARDLHDLLGQTLTGIVVRSQLAQRLARSDPDAGVAEMAQVESAAREALTQVRATVSGYRQIDLDDELVNARAALTAAGVELTVARDPDLVLTPSAASALGLALREAVTNVVRHAHAAHCTVTLRTENGQVLLEISDDGVGGDGGEGNGLRGMQERAAALGGQMRRRTRGGTAVTVAVPASVTT